MAEVIIGVVASGAGLLSLAIQLVEKAQSIREFHGRVKNAPDTLLGLSHQLETVSLLLRQLETHRQHDSYNAELLGRCISLCQHSATQMGALVQKLEERLARLRLLGRIMAALRDDEFRRLLTEVEQAKSSIMLAFQMYTLYGLNLIECNNSILLTDHFGAALGRCNRINNTTLNSGNFVQPRKTEIQPWSPRFDNLVNGRGYSHARIQKPAE
jgi:hypothetical protein